jgi:hypothetical protein
LSAFKSDLIGKINGRRIILTQALMYVSDLLDGACVIVPEGFNSDLASVPRGLWNLIPPWGPYADAAVVHDFLYQTQLIKPRSFVDSIFLEAMAVKQCRWAQRWVIYLGVRVGGWVTWKHYENTIANRFEHPANRVS